MAASRPRCRISRTSPSWPGSCRRCNPASVAEYLGVRRLRLCAVALLRHVGRLQGDLGDCRIRRSVELVRRAAFASPISRRRRAGCITAGPTCRDRRSRSVSRRRSTRSRPSRTPIRSTVTSSTFRDARYGIVTTGKGHLDLMEALRLLGIDEAECRSARHRHLQGRHGVAARPTRALEFVRDKRRGAGGRGEARHHREPVQGIFLRLPGHKPQRMVGKDDEDGHRLIPWTGELSPLLLAPILAKRLDAHLSGARACGARGRAAAGPCRASRSPARRARPISARAARTTPRPRCRKARKALAGIGCHFMASWMDRETSSLIQMGGEGVNWVASSLFTGRSTSSRISARAPIIIRAPWRSGRRSRRRPTSPTRSCSTTPSP